MSPAHLHRWFQHSGRWLGSGPRAGIIGVYPGSAVGVFRQYCPPQKLSAQGVEFVFDHRSGVLVVGHFDHALSPHEVLVTSLRLSLDDTIVVGGHFFRWADERWTNEASGHYGQNWSPVSRDRYREFLIELEKHHGIRIQHQANHQLPRPTTEAHHV